MLKYSSQNTIEKNSKFNVNEYDITIDNLSNRHSPQFYRDVIMLS